MNKPFLTPPLSRGPGRPKAVVQKPDPLAAIAQVLARINRRQVSRIDRLEARLSMRETIATILLTIVSGGTMLMTYFGISMQLAEVGDNFIQKGLALAFAVIVGTLSWLGWYHLFGIVDQLRNGRLATASIASFAYLLMIAAIDAQLIMLAIAGGTATQFSLVDTARHYEIVRTEIFESTTKARQLLPAMKAQQARFAELEQQEIEGGAMSGSTGEGRVSAAFGQVATLLESLNAEISRGLATADGLQDDITLSLKGLKAQVYLQGDIRARMESASSRADELDELLGSLGQYDYAVSIKATLDSLETLFPAAGASASEFESRQNQEVARIAEMARPVAGVLRNALASMATAEATTSEVMRPMGPADAVKHYWQRLIAEWIAAIFVDVAPGLLLVILIAGHREVAHARTIETEEV